MRCAASVPEWDVLVVGAGPAGALASYLLARRGWRVLLVDRKTFPRHKVCGGCLNAGGVQTLVESGLSSMLSELPHEQLSSFHLHQHQQNAAIRLPGGIALERSIFDSHLVGMAEDVGCEFLPEVTAHLLPRDATAGWRTVELKGVGKTGRNVRARVVLKATGVSQTCTRLTGELACTMRPGGMLGFSATVPWAVHEWAAGQLHMIVDGDAYVGVVSTGGEHWHVAGAATPRRLKRHGSPARCAADVLSTIGIAVPEDLSQAVWHGTGPVTQSCQRPASHRLLAIGDACGYVEPFTGDGMAWALHSADIVVPIVEQGLHVWQDACERRWIFDVRHTLSRQQRLCRWLTTGIRRGWAVRGGICFLNRCPSLAERFVRTICERRPNMRNQGE